MMIIMFWTLMIGFMSGAITRFIESRLKQGDIFITMTIGLSGSVLGGWLGSKVGIYEFGSYYGLIASFIGSLISLITYHFYIVKFGPPPSPMPDTEVPDAPADHPNN